MEVIFKRTCNGHVCTCGAISTQTKALGRKLGPNGYSRFFYLNLHWSLVFNFVLKYPIGYLRCEEVKVGLPQGNALSPILFNFGMATIFLPSPVLTSANLYADDVCISTSGKGPGRLKEATQTSLTELSNHLDMVVSFFLDYTFLRSVSEFERVLRAVVKPCYEVAFITAAACLRVDI